MSDDRRWDEKHLSDAEVAAKRAKQAADEAKWMRRYEIQRVHHENALAHAAAGKLAADKALAVLSGFDVSMIFDQGMHETAATHAKQVVRHMNSLDDALQDGKDVDEEFR